MHELTQNEIDVLLRYVASPEEVKEESTQRRFERIDPHDVKIATDSLLERGLIERHSAGVYRSPWLEATAVGRETAQINSAREATEKSA